MNDSNGKFIVGLAAIGWFLLLEHVGFWAACQVLMQRIVT